MYDVFLSYPHKRSSETAAIAKALRARGLVVWVDESDIADFAGITNSIVAGLAQAKALVAYYAAEYANSRACQWELTAAFLAAAKEGDPRRRILVINPESTTTHIHPVELRDARFITAPTPDDRDSIEGVVARVHAHVAALTGSFGTIETIGQPRWYGAKAIGYHRFVGRLPDLWLLHSALHATELPVITDASGLAVARLQGMGGVGKTLLAEEYAVRFAAAYPGGIFWLYALGIDRPAMPAAAERKAQRAQQILNFAVALGLPTEGRRLEDVEGHLARELGLQGAPFLWVVDDLPSGLEQEALMKWLAPHPLGKTLLTTRSREYAAFGTAVDLGELTSDEAYALLTKPPDRRLPRDAAEETEARAIVDRLGRHALAVDVAGAAMRMQSFDGFLAALDDRNQDELEFAQHLTGLLPTGHEPSIAATLLRSLRLLDAEAWDYLRLGSLLAAAPIPATLVQAVFAKVDGLEAGR